MITTQILDAEELKNRNEILETEVVGLKNTVTYLNGQLEWFKRQLFGKKSERLVSNCDEKQLFLEGFENLQAKTEEETQEVPPHKRRKPNRDGKDKIALDPDMPVERTVIDLPEEEKICQETGKPLVKIGEEVTHKLAHEPGSYYIKEIIRLKYAHPEKPEAGIQIALLPDTLLPKCQADDSFLAHIITEKFASHMPLYRIAEKMELEGVKISRKLLSQWVIRCGMALKPLYEVMVRSILKSKNIFIDETPVKLQDKHVCQTAYMWVVVGGECSDPPYRVYDFRPNRKHDNVLDILQGYQGGLHSDKYAAYQKLAEQKRITWFPCWAHIRRKFFEAEAGDPALRTFVLRKIRYLFMLEKVAWRRSAEERLRIRKEKEIPIIEELIAKIKGKLLDGRILPKSKLREALGYFCGLIPYLKNYTEHPFARLDNNVAERAVRPLAIGRKNWLFFGSEDGGEAGAILLSFVQTCRGLDINPREYLEDIFRRLMGHSASKLEELLPDRWLEARRKSQKQKSVDP